MVDFQWRGSFWEVLGAEGFGGLFREGFKVFLGSGRRVRELETWSLQVCRSNLLWIQNLSLFVPPKFAKNAALEALEAGVKLVNIITETIPIHDTAEIIAVANEKKALVIGPTSIGIMSPGKAKMGAIASGASRQQLGVLTSYGKNIGIAFQIVDDILDIIGTKETLGKSVGKDQAVEKVTYPALLGLSRSRADAGRYIVRAKKALEKYPKKNVILCQLAEYIIERTN